MAGFRFLFRFLLLTCVALALVLAYGFWWIGQPLRTITQVQDLVVDAGQGAPAIAQKIVPPERSLDATLLMIWFRVSGQSRQIKAGSYELEPGITPSRILDKLVKGEQALRSITFVEGWTFAQIRQALDKQPYMRHETQGKTAAEIMTKLGQPTLHPEGQFYPDTYRFAKNSSDISVLQTAMIAMNKQLDDAWKNRIEPTPLRSPQELLILASIVEKETGAKEDRGMVASVFHNRLKIGMRLQTDPTVIYGLGGAFNGNLRKVDLQTDTPYNSYTRAGLPPSPIAMPSKAALWAAARPAASNALYFVAKGDGTGSSHFSQTLEEHNRAVNQYILRKPNS